MSVVESSVVLFFSLLVFAILLYISYKVSYKLGIKKALYRTTYIFLCIIFAFIMTPLVNNFLYNLDLRDMNITLYYKGNEFYTIIDFVEEVIAHANFLNSLYAYFPNLKDLFMDYPQVILAPIVYVILFICFLILWLPLYLYLSYKRKRRILYDREDVKKHHVWAGALGCFQCVCLISVVLSPLNGINRMYNNAIQNTLDENYNSLCDEHELLSAFAPYCDALEVYDSTVFAYLGVENGLSDYIFDALTRISYDDGYTNFSKETSLIVKSGVVLAQSGLIDAALANTKTIDLDVLINNNLTEEDIDIILDTLNNSKYSDNLIRNLEEIVVNTVNELVYKYLGVKMDLNYVLTKDETIEEIKILLNALNIMSNNTLLNDILYSLTTVKDFVDNVPLNKQTDKAIMAKVMEVINAIDIDQFAALSKCMLQSKVFGDVLPHIIDNLLGDIRFNALLGYRNLLGALDEVMEFAKILKRIQPTYPIEMITELEDRDLPVVADVLTYYLNCDEAKYIINYILSEIFVDFDTVFIQDLYEIENWDSEVYYLRELCKIVYKVERNLPLDLDEAKNMLNLDSQVVQYAIKIARNNVDYIWSEAMRYIADSM